MNLAYESAQPFIPLGTSKVKKLTLVFHGEGVSLENIAPFLNGSDKVLTSDMSCLTQSREFVLKDIRDRLDRIVDFISEDMTDSVSGE